jgi:hypothetical protein
MNHISLSARIIQYVKLKHCWDETQEGKSDNNTQKSQNVVTEAVKATHANSHTAHIVKLIKAAHEREREREQIFARVSKWFRTFERVECEEKEVINVTVNHTHVFNEFQNI